MLFKKENYDKIESIICDLNDSCYNDNDLLDIRYLELNKTDNKVYEVHKVFDSDDISNRKLLKCERYDITKVFSGMLLYIAEE